MKPKKTPLFLFCLLVFGRLSAQPNEYLFSHLDFTNGLSNNHVTCMYKDGKGFMWFGTLSGLNRYDGYQFRLFKHDARDQHSITDNYIEQIFEGPEGKMWVDARAGRFNIYDFALDQFDGDYLGYLRKRGLPESWLINIVNGKSGFWFVYRDQGLYHYLPDGKVIALRPGGAGPMELSTALIAGAREDSNGDLWVVHENGLLEKVDSRENKVVYRTEVLKKDFGNDHTHAGIYIDGQDDLWIYSNGVFKGTYYYHPATRELRHFALDAGERRLNNNVIYSALQDGKGLIWLATDHGGVNIIDKRDFSVKYVAHIEDDGKSLSENSTTSLFKDNLGTMWVGTFKSGISYYHQSRFQFPQYRHEPHRRGSLSFDDVNNFVEDAAGNIWIASNGGGLIYFNRKTNTFSQYLHDERNKNSLSNNIVVSLLLDKDNKLWIGTYFGGLDCFDGKRFVHYRHDDKDTNSLAEDRIMYIYEDSDRQLWIGTLAEGMDRLDRRDNKFYHYKYSQPGSIRNGYVSSITEDAHKNLWVATGYGIDVLEKNTGRFHHYSMDSNRLSSDNVILLFRDSRQNMWAATREGLNVFDPDKKTFQSFSVEDGLPDNTVRSIQEDSRHDLWISTPNGLSRIQLSRGKDSPAFHIRCRNFHEQDGLQGREFNERAGLATKDGLLIFGGPNGFNIFNPGDIIPTGKTPPIAFTGLEVFNKPVHVGDTTGGHAILKKAITETNTITLHYKDKVFSIEFASLGFIYNARNKYTYTLEGFSRNWLTTDGKIRKATYTNLDAGEYLFRVKASDEDGEWYDQEATLKIIVLPPFWKTPLAYFVYFLLFAGSLILARRMILQRAKMRFALEHERRETRRMHEMDLMKIRFFTNMSHELRTPLSLILAPVDKLLDQPVQSDPRRQYEMIRRNARRLLHLVNQLLDFRKMEVNELKLHIRPGDVVRFTRDIYSSFIDLAEKKNISFSYQEDCVSLLTQFDHDKLERILFNLLSNAFKFTPENGNVSVSLHTVRGEEGVLLSIRIKDTGIGIAPDKQEKIFDRFFQSDVPETILNQGSGIGLSITQEFVRMHHGHLSVESELNKGSCFTVSLPFKEIIAPGAGLLSGPATADATVETRGVTAVLKGIAEEAQESTNKRTILIIEDNEDFRFYLKDNLRAFYRIIEASDGKEGWRKVLAAHPHLVVSDVSMPVMDGIQLCEKIRSDERTRQIPVILLTAMTGEGSELRGLQTGATDYITKPFNFEVLLSKIRNALEYNEIIKKTYQRQVQAQPVPVEIASADDAFMQDVLEQIEKNMGNPDFSVGELSMQFHASRSTFYKRLLLLTGKTPVELIRHIRLKRAAELLEKSQLTVAEIAYTVGFNNPKYFTQYFKMEFNRSPSAYRSEKRSPGNGSSKKM
jgi:signal transduction histidine kinase/ligand-binding sensor domain-containing protein/DNA-binding response OmpR family regulator